MFRIMSAEEAVGLIKDGDVIGLNSFVAIAHPEKIHDAITERFRRTGHPRNLTIISASGFGTFDPDRSAELYVREGAVSRIIGGYFGSMPSTRRLVLEDRFEAYNLPLGPMSHALRAQAGGHSGYLSKIGLGLFVDPRIEGPGLNSLSRDESLVRLVELDGEEYLKYTLPEIDIAIIKATSVDDYGNISFEDEFCSIDAFALAQMTRRNRGKVIVQVERQKHESSRPRDVVVPAMLVDAVVICPGQNDPGAEKSLSGNIKVTPAEMQYWYKRLEEEYGCAFRSRKDASADIIAKRALKELHPGDVVNIGFGIPETVCKYAAQAGILESLTLTVESGGIGGLPAGGFNFGSMIGAGMICNMCELFDFYDGGGLSICFMGGLEMDRFGNVNAHRSPDYISGIGGFGNITAATHNVIFCITFNTKGLDIEEKDGRIVINREGSIPKIVEHVRSISFSGKQAIKNKQRVLYVTDRCVFELRPEGLTLTEVYPGIDAQKDIFDRLPFAVIDGR